MNSKFKKIAAVSLSSIMLMGSMPIAANANELDVSNPKAENVSNINQDRIRSSYNMSDSDVENAKIKRDAFSSEDTEELFTDEICNLLKIEFQEYYGTEDSFKFISDENGIITEVNGFKGLIKLVENGEETILDYFQIIDEQNKESNLNLRAPARPGAWQTQGPDRSNLKVVKGSTRDTLTAHDPIKASHIAGSKKTYTKPTNNWYSGYTKGYYDNIQKARQSWGTSAKYGGSSFKAALWTVGSKFVQAKDFTPTTSKVSAALKAASAGVAIYDLANCTAYFIAYLGNMSSVYYNFGKL